MNVSIRRALPADAVSISNVLWTSYGQVMPWLQPRYGEAEARHWVEHVLLATSAVWVAVEGEQVVGYAAVGANVLEQLYILPGFRRQGIGKQLLAAARDEAGNRLSVYAFARNTGARRFYERHGFARVTGSEGTRNEEREPVLYEWRRAEPGHEARSVGERICPAPGLGGA